VKLPSPTEFYQKARVAPYWLSAPSMSLLLSPAINRTEPDFEVFPELSSPRSLRPHDYPLLGFSPSSGFDPHSPPHASRQRHLPWDLDPYSACGIESPLNPGLASPGTFQPQGFAPSRRITPLGALRVYFTPVALMGFHPSGVSPPKEPRHLTRCTQYPLGVSSQLRRRPWHTPVMGAPVPRV